MCAHISHHDHGVFVVSAPKVGVASVHRLPNDAPPRGAAGRGGAGAASATNTSSQAVIDDLTGQVPSSSFFLFPVFHWHAKLHSM